MYLNNFEKSISLGLIVFAVKTSSLCNIHGAVKKHLRYYFVRPSNLSVSIHTAFWKCNSLLSKAHKSWKPQHSGTCCCVAEPNVLHTCGVIIVVVFVHKFQVQFYVYLIHD